MSISKNNKQKYAFWLKPSLSVRIDSCLESANCKSRSEFVEQALHFFIGYLDSEDASAYLSNAVHSALTGHCQQRENRLNGLFFKLAVEVSMMTHVIASSMHYTDRELRNLRGMCVQDVKQTFGRVSLDDAVHYQRGE